MRFTTIVLLLLLVPCVTFAQETEITEDQISRSQDLYTLGEKAYTEERWAYCAIYFERSFAIVLSPELLYNIGRCYEELAVTSGDAEHYRRAITAYTRYSREAEVENTDALDLNIYRLQEALFHLIERQEAASEELIISEEYALDEPNVVTYRGPALVPRDPEIAVHESSFWWPTTLYLGIATLVTLVATIVTGVISVNAYNDLESTCGGTTEGCDPNEINRVNVLATGTSVLGVLTGAMLVATGVSFYFEFSDHDANASPSAFGLRFTGSF